jgi:DNA-binding XRE family transcriptional regulator
MNNIEEGEVQNIVQLYSFCDNIIKKCVQYRKDAGLSQKHISEWLKVDVRKIIELEKGKIDVELTLRYADKFFIGVNLQMKENIN